MLTKHPRRLETFDYLGLYRYSLTFCTHERARYFTDSARIALVLEQFVRSATENECGIVTYCFMPDHVHLLIEGLTESANGRAFIDRAKQYSAYYFKQTFGMKLWQRYGFERTLRDTEDALGVARYILENPIRAGLVERVQDYPFCGSVMHPLEHLLDAVAMMP